MMKDSILSIVFFLAIGTNCFAMKQDINSASPKDTVLVGKVIAMDTASIKTGQSKIGYLTYYGLFHIAIKLDDGSVVQLVRVFNVLDEYNLFRQKFGLQINQSRIFYVYNYKPCICELPRMSGHCDGDVYYPAKSNVVQPYSEIYRIIGVRPVR